MFGYSSRIQFQTILVLIFFTSVVKCDDWPKPTCYNLDMNTCLMIVYDPISNKTNLIFHKHQHDSSYYTTLNVRNNLQFIPPNLFTIFNNLENLNFYKNPLSNLETSDFLNGNKLKIVKIRNCLQLKEIPNFAFHGADNIKNLSIYESGIEKVGENAFSNLQNLYVLDLSWNEIEHLDSNTFENNFMLEELRLENNKLSNIDFISKLNNLETLSLDFNRISSIEPNLFRNSYKLTTIYLLDNCLLHFNFDSFPITMITNLDLTGNYLNEFSTSGIINNFPSLTEFHIQDNNFNCSYLRDVLIDSTLDYIQNDRSVNTNDVVQGISCISDGSHGKNLDEKCILPLVMETTTATINNIDNITHEVWPYLTCSDQNFTNTCYIHVPNSIVNKKEFIFLKGQQHFNDYYSIVMKNLHVIPKNLFNTFINLMIIDLTDCQSLRLESGDFENGNKLKNVKIRGCWELTEIPNFIFHGADNINVMELYMNGVQTVGEYAFNNLQNLQVLDMSSNKIESLNSNTFINNLNLKELRLDNNKLRNVDFISKLNYLESVSLSYNRISSIAPNLLENKNKLSALFLSGNCFINFGLDNFPVTNINYLSLQNNYLNEMSISGIQSKFPALAVLIIQDNNFNCTHYNEIFFELINIQFPNDDKETHHCNEDDNQSYILDGKCI